MFEHSFRFIHATYEKGNVIIDKNTGLPLLGANGGVYKFQAQ